MEYKKVDIIIPAYKPDGKYLRLLEMLSTQSYPISRVIVFNTGEQFYSEFEANHKIPTFAGKLQITHINTDEFDHGGTRGRAVATSDAEYFLMMTQDAIPYNNQLIEKLVDALEQDEKVAVAYARQMASSDASVTERYIRSFNYPDKSLVKSKEDLPRLGIKTFFCSNVCAAYRRDSFDSLGGFVKKTIFNEDMIYAASAINSGYKVAYVADAKVIHSHNYSGSDQLHRNFDLAVSQTEHPEVFAGLSSEGEGTKLVKGCIKYLGKQHKLFLVPGFVWNCGCRYIGFRLGKMYKILPKTVIMKLTSNPAYWL